MSTEKFIKKLVIKIIVLVIVIAAVTTFLTAGGTIINNYIALGQMENNDGMFVLMEMYNNFLKPTLHVVVYAVTASVVIFTGLDIYKFIKSKKEGD